MKAVIVVSIELLDLKVLLDFMVYILLEQLLFKDKNTVPVINYVSMTIDMKNEIMFINFWYASSTALGQYRNNYFLLPL